MTHPSKSDSKQFICSCYSEVLFKNQVIEHLKLRGTHNITKISPPNTSKDFKNSILNKIKSLSATQLQIQASFNQLIKTIIQNTSAIIQNLSKIINIYRKLLFNPPQVNNIKNLQVINTFKLNSPLYTSLTQHFQQQTVAETSTINTITKNVKTQVIDIRRNHVGGMLCMAMFSDEKRVVTGGNDGAVRIWDLETKSQIWFILKHKDQVRSLALGNAEDLVLTGSNDTSVRLWNIKMKRLIHNFQGHTSGVTSVLISQDQSTGFSGSADHTIRSWNLKSLTPQRTLSFQFFINQVCLISEGRVIVACGQNGFVLFFNFKDNKHSYAPFHHNSLIKSICFKQNEEQFITGSEDGTVEVWLTNGLKRHFFQKKHSSQITSIKISTCSILFATGSDDRTVIVWDLKKLCTIRLLKNLSSVNSLYFVKNSSSLLICCAFAINRCSLSTFVNEEKLKTKPLHSIAISSDLKYAAYGFFHVCLLNIKNKTKVVKSSNIRRIVRCLKFSPNSAFVGVGCLEGEITILSIPNLVQLHLLYTKLSSIECLSFSRSIELIGFSDFMKNVKVMSVKTKEVLYENEGKAVLSVSFCSSDEKFIYSDVDGIYVTKNFKILKKISFGVQVKKIFVNGDNGYILVNHWNGRWSIIKGDSLEKIFEDESRKLVKKWCTKREEIEFTTHLSFFFS